MEAGGHVDCVNMNLTCALPHRPLFARLNLRPRLTVYYTKFMIWSFEEATPHSSVMQMMKNIPAHTY